MAGSLNKVQLIGNVTKDPVIREVTSNGETTKVANLTIATNRSWKDKTGKVQDEAEFTPVVLWRKQAELVEQYVTKGKKIYIEGYLKTRSWDAEDGTKKFMTEVIAFDNGLIFLGANGEHMAPGEDEGQTSTKPVAKVASKPAPAKKDEGNIEDIPF